MYGGAPTIYVDYTGYDAIAHHCGPERAEAIDALEGIDRAIGSLMKAARYTKRPYRLVVLSDHGQSLGATFKQRCGEPLEAVLAALLPGNMTVVGTTDAVESAGMGRRIAAELGRGRGLGPLLARRLAHIYFTSQPGRATAEAIEAGYPGLIEALSRHPGIGALLVRSAAGHALVLGPHGRSDLSADPSDGSEPLADYGPRAAENLRHLEGFATAGDLILLGAVDRISGEVTGFEELVGSHGGLGGWQGEPFILCPANLGPAEEPLLGAPAVFRQLVAWRAEIQAERAG